MLQLLVDEHISPAVADGLRRRSPSLKVYSMAKSQEGAFLGQDDAACIAGAAAQNLTLVTCDRRTIPLPLKLWAEEGRNHGGVVFVDERTIPAANIGGLVRGLAQLHKETGKWDWTNRVVFLRR